MQEPIEFRVGTAALALSPEAGGAVTRYASDHEGGTVEWLRPASADAVERRAAGETGCFPMVPFSNRIRDARFHFDGRLIELPRNFPPEPHAIHGHGWRAPWTVASRESNGATLEYRHAADEWPWSYHARQAFELREDGLVVEMSVTNEATDPMPVGFGLHPYLVRTPQVRLHAAVGAMWQTGTDRMPAELVAPPAQLALEAAGLSPDATALDNNFIGFEGQAVIEWPEWNARLRMMADPLFSCCVVYTPPGRDFFCAEPATNCIDAFNLADMGRTDTGLIVLGPGETRQGVVRLVTERLEQSA